MKRTWIQSGAAVRANSSGVPPRHLLGTAAGWGGLPEWEAFYTIESEPRPAGHFRIVSLDVPVDAFWSISVDNRDGYFEAASRGPRRQAGLCLRRSRSDECSGGGGV